MPDKQTSSPWEDRTTIDLFRELRSTNDPALRAHFIAQHEGLVRHVAKDYHDSGEPFEDIMSVGMLGLIHAVDRFDPERGTKFATFAVPTIRGEIQRYFRDHTWGIRVPRRIQELSLKAREMRDRLALERGRPPTYAEVARALSVPEEDLVEALEVGRQYDSISLEAIVADEESTGRSNLDRAGEEDERLTDLAEHDQLARALRQLPPRERVVLVLRFFQELSQQEVGRRLGVSQMHVSRLQQQALGKLRKILGRDED
ncbi:MAG TPA: SigB/SigF/SigG family RNA polymerase sigma factor [Armatimonadota bacterium]|jgi:RNA polymerase sigma-B factor